MNNDSAYEKRFFARIEVLSERPTKLLKSLMKRLNEFHKRCKFLT